MDWFSTSIDWVIQLGTRYNVDPIIFASIYIGAIPFFMVSLIWLVRSIKQKKPIVVPVLVSGFFFLSSYLYLIVVGRNIPFWVYVLIAVLVVYGIYSIRKEIRNLIIEDV